MSTNKKTSAAHKAVATRRANVAKAKRSASSKKAAATRAARVAFENKYGTLTFNVMKNVALGRDDAAATWVASNEQGNTNARLGAYKANLSRPGTMRKMALACNFGL